MHITVMPVKFPVKKANEVSLEVKDEEEPKELRHFAKGAFPSGDRMVFQKKILSRDVYLKKMPRPIAFNQTQESLKQLNETYCYANLNHTLDTALEQSNNGHSKSQSNKFRYETTSQTNITQPSKFMMPTMSTNEIKLPLFDETKAAGMTQAIRDKMSALCRQSLSRLR